jgi:hypothetical protein
VGVLARRLLPVFLTLACAPTPPPAPVLTAAPSCVVADSLATDGDTTTILLAEAVDPAHAPLPTNDAESLVFRQLYETLLRVDCVGQVRPGLAIAWGHDDLEWNFTLREEAAFWDGSTVDATTLLEEWHRANPATAVAGIWSDGRSLTLFLSAEVPPEYFASPALRVVRRRPDSPWLQGTSPWMPQVAADSTPMGANLLLTAGGRGRRERRVLRFGSRPGADPRDLLDAGTDLLLTRDPRAVAYARGLDGWSHAPAGWDRVYLLLSSLYQVRDPAAVAGIRDELASGALRGEGRPPEPDLVSWADRCSAARADSVRDTSVAALRRRVVYPREDPAARALAERLVARAETHLTTLVGPSAAPPGTTITAAGLDAPSFARALAEPQDLGLVLPVYPLGAQDCLPVASLATGWRLMEPLVETRAQLLVRPGATRLVRDRDGIVLEPATRQ